MKPLSSNQRSSTTCYKAPVFLILLCAFFFAGAFTPAQDQKNSSCRKCDGKGWVRCKSHPKNVKEGEIAIRCSEAISCKKCGGTIKVDCAFCNEDLDKEKQKAEQEALAAWLAKMREIDTHMKLDDIMHCESAHFRLTFNLPRISTDKFSLKTHRAMHLYLERLEELYQDVIKDLGAKDEDFLEKTHVMIWERESQIVRSAAKYCNQRSNTKSYLVGKAPVFTIYYNKGFLHEEFELHQAVVHNVVHCLLSNVWNGIWPGNIKGAWLDAGYAHYYELHYFKQYGGGVRNYCYREGDTMGLFKFGKWKSSVRKAVDKNEAPSFLELSAKNLDMLTREEHMYSWSYVDFILKEYPDKFGTVALLVKQRKGISEVMKEALKMTPFQFEERWKGYVQSSYSTKEEPWGKPIMTRRRR